MNGARTIFMRKGYWLTGLAAAVLLAASSGTALAQDGPAIGIKSVTIEDADSKGVVDEGISTEVTVLLTAKLPEGADALITLNVTGDEGGKGEAEDSDESDADVRLGRMTFTITEGNNEGSVPLLTLGDEDAVDEKFQISAVITLPGVASEIAVVAASPDNIDTTPAGGKIKDNEVQTYVFKVDANDEDIKESEIFKVTLRAKPDRPLNEEVTIYLGAPTGYTLTSGIIDKDDLRSDGVTLGDGSESGDPNPLSRTIDVEAPGNDKNRTDDVIMLEALTGTVASNKPVGTSESITVLDIHQLPTDISGEANGVDEDGKETNVVTMVKEGGKANLYVTVVNEDDDRISDTNAENFTVTPTLSGSQVLDARIMPTYLEVTEDDEERGGSGNYVVGPFTIEVVNDEDIGMEALTVSLDVTGDKGYGSGTSSGTFSINLEDGTLPLVFVKDDAYEAIMMAIGDAVAPGSVVTIMTDDMFDKAEGYTASFGASVEGDSISASASGDRITLTASSDMTGESKVTVTATARMESSSFIPSQTVSNVAEITFPVMVGAAAEPVPALPLIAQWLLGLGLMGGGARQLFRRRRQG